MNIDDKAKLKQATSVKGVWCNNGKVDIPEAHSKVPSIELWVDRDV